MPISDGIGLRMLMWLVLTAVTVLFVLRYAATVKADPSESRVGFLPGDTESADAPMPPPLTGRHIAVLVFVTFTFAVMIFGIIPWSQIIGGADADPTPGSSAGASASSRPGSSWPRSSSA